MKNMKSCVFEYDNPLGWRMSYSIVAEERFNIDGTEFYVSAYWNDETAYEMTFNVSSHSLYDLLQESLCGCVDPALGIWLRNCNDISCAGIDRFIGLPPALVAEVCLKPVVQRVVEEMVKNFRMKLIIESEPELAEWFKFAEYDCERKIAAVGGK